MVRVLFFCSPRAYRQRRNLCTVIFALPHQKQLTQCVVGWQCGACGLNGVDRLPPRINAVPYDVTCNGYVHGRSPCARSCSNIGINSAKCSSAIERMWYLWWTERRSIIDDAKKSFFFLIFNLFSGLFPKKKSGSTECREKQKKMDGSFYRKAEP